MENSTTAFRNKETGAIIFVEDMDIISFYSGYGVRYGEVEEGEEMPEDYFGDAEYYGSDGMMYSFHGINNVAASNIDEDANVFFEGVNQNTAVKKWFTERQEDFKGVVYWGGNNYKCITLWSIADNCDWEEDCGVEARRLEQAFTEDEYLHCSRRKYDVVKLFKVATEKGEQFTDDTCQYFVSYDSAFGSQFTVEFFPVDYDPAETDAEEFLNSFNYNEAINN